MKTIGTIAPAAVAVLLLLSAGRARAEGATCAPAAAGGEWRSYGHDYANTRHQEQETKIGPLEALTLSETWSQSATSWGGGGDFPGTPVIADGCVYVGSTKGWVFAANADTGELVWKSEIPGGATFGSPSVEGGRVFVGTASSGHSAVAALDQATGAILWTKEVDDQAGAEIYSSATFFEGMVIVGVSGGAAELSSDDIRNAFHGSIVLLDAATGDIIKKIYTVPLDAKDPGGNIYAGGGVWAPTPAIDTLTKYGYFSVGNPFNQQYQHENTDSVVKVDLDRTRASFGEIVGRYNGDVDQYYPGAKDLPCVSIPSGIPPYYPRGFGACADLDLDFGTSPNIFWSKGQQLVGAGQKSGVYHAFDANTFEKKWTALVGLPSAVGGIVGSAAYDGAAITGPITQLGYLWSVNGNDGSYRWFAPVLDGAHYGQPVTSANGVVYTVDLKGFLDAYDAATGIPLLLRPMALSAGASPLKTDPILSLGGVSVARNTVYASVGTIGALNGYIIAYRPGGSPLAQQSPTPPAPTPPGQTPPPTPVPTPGSTPAPAAVTDPAIVAIPGTFLTTYATPVTVIPEGGKLAFINLDVAEHDVVARENGMRTDCPAYLNRAATPQDPVVCPLFWTTLIGLSTTSTPVIGVEDAQAGKTYDFYCTKHPGMFGKLIVIPGG